MPRDYSAFTQNKTIFSLVRFSSRFSVKQRLIAFGVGGLGVVLVVTALQLFASGRVESAVRTRERALDVDANLFRRQAALKSFLLQHDSLSISTYQSLSPSGKNAVDWVARQGGLSSLERSELRKANSALDSLYSHIMDRGLTRQKAEKKLTGAISLADNAASGMLLTMEMREADKQMIGERLDASESEFLNICRDGKILSLFTKSLVCEYSLRGDTLLENSLREEIREKSSLFDAFESFGRQLSDSHIQSLVHVYSLNMKEAFSAADSVFLLARAEQAYAAEFDSTGQVMSSITGSLLTAANTRLAAIKTTMGVLTFGVVIASAVFFILLAASILFSITTPIQALLASIDRVGKGDFSAQIAVSGTDEISQIALKLRDTISHLGNLIAQVKTGAESLSTTSRTVGQSAESLTNTSSRLGQESNSANATVQQLSNTVSAMSSSAAEMSGSVSSVASAIEEMSASLNEVAKNCVNESRIAADANLRAREVNTKVETLGSAARQIGKIVNVISDIADKTNLLALNATIEAASAGAAGRGFAVVASEVKDLARQTAKATNEIRTVVESIQAATTGAIGSIGEITGIIENIDTISQTIVSAVEEQSSTINEISQSMVSANTAASSIAYNVSQSAQGLQSVAASMQNVDTAVKDTGKASGSLGTTVSELSRLATDLTEATSRFTL